MHDNIITLDHGSGGKVSNNLIKSVFLKYFDNKIKYKDMPLRLQEILDDKSFYASKPDLKTILALKERLNNKFL